MREANVNRAGFYATRSRLLPALVLAFGFSSNLMQPVQAEPSKDSSSKSSAAPTGTAAKSATALFVDTKNGYSIEFPSDWKTKTDPIVSVVAASGIQIKEANPFPNVKIVARSLPTGETLDSICDTSMRQWAALWKVESDQHSNNGKTPTRRLVLMQLIPQFNLRTRVLKAFAVSGDNYYIISCADKPEHFEQSKQTFEAIVNSLKLGVK
ncbi:hypothetical protein KBI23_06000 [bacterium]|nr:hypothetical protein [bacterium]MBP9809550.1 hypothetical protein [bacterium]